MTRAADAISAFAAFPFAELEQITGDETALVVAPHPDDESLGCGGFIAESCARRRPPIVLTMTDGTASHPSSLQYPRDRLRSLRERETQEALAILGLLPERLYFMRLSDSAMPLGGQPYDSAIEQIRALIRRFQCRTLLAPWILDPHCDHQTTQRMVRSAAEGLPVSISSYPVWGWLLPPDTILPDTPAKGSRLDITPHLRSKRRAIASHRSQYSDLIKDDPKGFRLPNELLATFERPYEVFIRTPS
jgi:LmbE family N-acetylglucosaminyl deacetylase